MSWEINYHSVCWKFWKVFWDAFESFLAAGYCFALCIWSAGKCALPRRNSFGSFIKLMKLHSTATWVSPRLRVSAWMTSQLNLETCAECESTWIDRLWYNHPRNTAAAASDLLLQYHLLFLEVKYCTILLLLLLLGSTLAAPLQCQCFYQAISTVHTQLLFTQNWVTQSNHGPRILLLKNDLVEIFGRVCLKSNRMISSRRCGKQWELRSSLLVWQCCCCCIAACNFWIDCGC